MLCEICDKLPATSSAIIDGTYYKNVCEPCKTAHVRVSSGHARWSRSIDVEDHEHEIQQPWNSDGTINARFAKLYPTQAKALFSDDELRRANRN